MSEVGFGPAPPLDSCFDASRDLLCTFTSAGVFTRVSESCVRITGYAPVVLMGQPLLSLVHPLDRELVARAFARVVERGHADDVPTRIRTRSGRYVPLRWSAVRVDSGGQVFAVAREMKHERERKARRQARAALKAAAAERERLRADLHDGLLQTLTGAALKLTGALRLLEQDPEAARGLLGSVAELLQQEQRELRFLVEDMKQGWQERRQGSGASVKERLADFSRRLRATWDIQLLSFVSGDGLLPEWLVRPSFGIVHEAVVNAVRHGKATAATVHLEVAADHALIRVADNGRGLGFTGTLDDAALRGGDRGPAVLKHRVWSLGGSLSVQSRADGVVVFARIPFEEAQ